MSAVVLLCIHLHLQECQGRAGGGSLSGGPGLLPLPGGVGPSSSSSSSHQQQQQHDPGPHHYHDDEEEEGVSEVTFKMLMKRGGKDDRTKELHVSTG